RFRLDEEASLDTRQIDNKKVREEQVARLNEVRRKRSEARVEEALSGLKQNAAMNEGNLLEAAIVAAKARATLGEISSALEEIFGRHSATPKIISGVYDSAYKGDAEYTELQRRIEKFTSDHDRAPSIFIAKMGQDGHDRGAKIIATAFADMGFLVHFGALFETAEEVANHISEMGVDAVGISSLAAGHKVLVPALVEQMKRRGLDDIPVVVGGVIPEGDYQFLLDAGVAEIFGPGTNVLQAAFSVLNRIEGRLSNK
ncbi:MAG TPA: methylmalonyl-CoA mutase, partial [Devosia sp.]|nr:methylmalonyl-CoA mutase [Devosia sp.]